MNYTFQEHFAHFNEDKTKYMDDVLRIFSDKILSKTAGLTVKSQILAVLLQNKDKESFKSLHKFLDLPEIVRACEILDTDRFKRQTKEKLKKHPESKKLVTRMAQLTSLTDGLTGGYENLSFSLSKIKIVKQWVHSLTKDQIEYRAMLFPSTTLWKKLADLTHLNPTTDFPAGCEWFLPYCFGKPLPDDNIANKFKTMTYDNFAELYDKYNFAYELIRTKLKLDQSSVRYMSKDSEKIKSIKISIVNREKLTTVLWYWDELVEEYNIIDVLQRIRNSEDSIDLSYGKIVDIISKTTNPEVMKELVKIGEERLNNYKINLEQPVAVFGDKSGSMEIAIKTSGIITSLLCCICNADLHLFHSHTQHFPDPPRTIADAVKFGKEVKTEGYTAPAASLMYYYVQQKKLATILLITDEEENNSCGGYRFADLYLKYLNEVCQNSSPTRLVFISFTDPNTDGVMVKCLKTSLIGRTVCGSLMTEERFNNLIKVFKFNVKDPDLNRMDVVLKYLSGCMN